MSKTNAGNFFEDFTVGQVIEHATPRTVTEGDRALYGALYPTRFAVPSSKAFAASVGVCSAEGPHPVEDARERAEILLKEVNHRVANSLQLVVALVKLQSNAVKDASAKEALAETQGRITAIALIHRKLYSSSDVATVSLDEYLGGLLEHLETVMRAEGHTATLRYQAQPVRLATDASVSLGVIVTEWITNAYKYAYPDGSGEIRVVLSCPSPETAELIVEDDGVGRSDAPQAKGTGLGTRIVNIMATDLDAKIDYKNCSPGTSARLTFPVAA